MNFDEFKNKIIKLSKNFKTNDENWRLDFIYFEAKIKKSIYINLNITEALFNELYFKDFDFKRLERIIKLYLKNDLDKLPEYYDKLIKVIEKI